MSEKRNYPGLKRFPQVQINPIGKYSQSSFKKTFQLTLESFCSTHRSVVIAAIPPAVASAFRIAVMTFCTGGSVQGLCMAGPAAATAVVHTAASFIGDPRVGSFIFC